MKYKYTKNSYFLDTRSQFFFIFLVKISFCMIIIEIMKKKRNFWNILSRDPIFSSNKTILALLLRWKNQHDSCPRSKVMFFFSSKNWAIWPISAFFGIGIYIEKIQMWKYLSNKHRFCIFLSRIVFCTKFWYKIMYNSTILSID